MDKTTLIIAIALFVIGAGLAWYLKPAERIYHTEHQQRAIDSLTTALVNAQSTKESLRDSLEGTSQKFQEYVQNHEGEVSSLTTIRGRLNTRIDALEDSLENVQSDYDLSFLCSDEPVEPRVLPYTRTFGNKLFEVTSYNRFTQDTFNDSLSLKHLRLPRIDLAILQSEDRRTVESIATSQDYDSLRVTAQTEIKPPKDGLHWSVLIAIGALVREGVRLFTK